MNRAPSPASRFTRRVARKPGKPVTNIVSFKTMMKQYPINFHFSMGTQVILRAITYLTHPSCGFRLGLVLCRVHSWLLCRYIDGNQTTKSHEPGITKRHKESAD